MKCSLDTLRYDHHQLAGPLKFVTLPAGCRSDCVAWHKVNAGFGPRRRLRADSQFPWLQGAEKRDAAVTGAADAKLKEDGGGDSMSQKRWARRPDESPRAYEAALLYFHMNANRSLAAVCRKLGKNVSLMKRWSSKYEWGARALAFDREAYQCYNRAWMEAAVEKALQGQEEEKRRVAEKHNARRNRYRTGKPKSGDAG